MKFMIINNLFVVFSLYENLRYACGAKIFGGNKFEMLLQKYMKPMKKLSDQFPNREIELQLEIDGSNSNILSVPKKSKYNRLHKPVVPITRSNIVSDINTSSTISTPELSTTSLVPSVTNTVSDPEQRPVSMTELKKAIEEYDKVIKNNDDNQPLLKRDLWMALGMKYGAKCNDGKQTQIDVKSEPKARSNNIEKLLQILKDGEVVKQNPLLTATSNENLQWFKIKIPKEIDNF